MRKFFVIAFSALWFSALASAAECKLAKPVPFTGDLLTDGNALKNVKLNEMPRFLHPENYQPATDTLSLYLFDIQVNGLPTHFLGASLWIDGKSEGIGFGANHIGDSSGTNFQGGVRTENGITTYQTRSIYRYNAAPGVIRDAVRQLVLKTQGSEIISASLIVPVMRIWKKEGTTEYAMYTGEHQTFCVLEAH